MTRSQDLKKFRETSVVTYLENHGFNFNSKIDRDEKIKLCSSDDFTSVIEEFTEKYDGGKAPIMISHVGGFYVTASLAGLSENICSVSKPYVLFFDRKSANIQNALFNSFLMQICDSKEEYICTLFNLSNIDIVKALKPAVYVSFIEEILSRNTEFVELSRKEKKETLKTLYEKDKENIDKEIASKFVNVQLVSEILHNDFNLGKIEKYAEKLNYDDKVHYELLKSLATGKLKGKKYTTFCHLANNITEYLSRNDNYRDLVNYLVSDIKINGENHILANNAIFEGYRSLFNKKGGSTVKFVSGIDISSQTGVKRLESILLEDKFMGGSVDKDYFSIDLAFIPHIGQLKEAYPFLKSNVQDYIMLYKDGTKKNHFVVNSTATLDERTLSSIGASFIETERKNRVPLTNLSKIDKRDGYPLLMFMAGANFGNIYHSEVDTQNMIDIAIANGVDTVYVQGLIYSTYYHHQTSRRLLNDPTYETLSSRLQAAHKVIERLNNAGIKVVYQMGDEEYHLYQDLFKIYVREQGVIGNDFLKREDLRSKYDWVRPIIIQELIPYLIRSGEDVVNFYTDEVNKTNVSKVCHAIKRYKEGLPLGDLAKYINPEFLKDSDMFKVVYSTIDKYSDKDSSLSVNLMSNPNFSSVTQYSKPNVGVIKNLRYFQSGEIDKYSSNGIPQMFVDSRQGFMSIAYEGDELAMNVPQMINDGYYIENPGLLSGIKEHVLEDPTHKRVTQIQTRPNYPGGWMVTGDIRERMIIAPYYKRTRDVMEYVQRSGNGFDVKTIGDINDWQMGSPTERPWYTVKFMDYLFNECNPTGLIINGDLQQGHNYPKYPNESRHLGAASVTQQMVSFTKLLRPYMRDAFGVIGNGFEIETSEYLIDANVSRKITDHLVSVDLIEHKSGLYGNVDRIKRDVDYSKVDLKLPNELKRYESAIRRKLSKVVNLEFADMLEGNHEWNTDWDHKGYNEIELLRQELENLREYSGSDIDLTLTEFLVNSKGDFVNAPYSFRTINGYNNIYGHCFKPGGKGGGMSPTVGISKWLEQMAGSSTRIDKVNSAHYHIFESSVIDNVLITITGGGAGQSGYEQNLGYCSQPLFVIERYMPDGRIYFETIGTKFLDDYEIKNPYIREKGIDNFIQECMTEEATIFDREEPKQVQKLYQRKLVAKKPNKVIGRKID